MTLFPGRQEAVKVLYKAAARLLDNAADFDSSLGRQLNRQFAEHCVELAEKIGNMGAVKIICDTPTSLEVEGIPFGLGFTIETKGSPDPDFEVEDDDKN